MGRATRRFTYFFRHRALGSTFLTTIGHQVSKEIRMSKHPVACMVSRYTSLPLLGEVVEEFVQWLLDTGYQRFLINQFRRCLPFAEVPIRLIIRQRRSSRKR